MKSFLRYSAIGTVALLVSCGRSQILIGPQIDTAPKAGSAREEAVTLPLRNAMPLAVTRAINENVERSDTKIVKVREFKIPGSQLAAASIVAGPDHNLWFAETQAIVRITVDGQMQITKLKRWEGYPGLLTVGPDGNIWANAAQLPPPGDGQADDSLYRIYRVTLDGRLTSFPLPSKTDQFSTGLMQINRILYFGLPVVAHTGRGSSVRNLLETISTDGIFKKIAWIHRSNSTGNGYIDAIRTPGPLIWLYDYQGNTHICSTAGHCAHRLSGYPSKYVGNLHGTVMAYSPADKSVYIDNQNHYTLVRYGLGGTRLRGYRNLDLHFGFGAIAYYRGNIWITLGGDNKARPNLGCLTPAGHYSELSLPFVGPTDAVTALAGGPDGHLWYLRGHRVGEILSEI